MSCRIKLEPHEYQLLFDERAVCVMFQGKTLKAQLSWPLKPHDELKYEMNHLDVGYMKYNMLILYITNPLCLMSVILNSTSDHVNASVLCRNYHDSITISLSII